MTVSRLVFATVASIVLLMSPAMAGNHDHGKDDKAAEKSDHGHDHGHDHDKKSEEKKK